MDANITLDEVVNDYLSQHQMPQSKYLRIMNLAIRGYRMFYYNATGFQKMVRLSVQANNTAVLPTDCLNKIAVGILNQKGEIASLVYDPLLSYTNSESNTRLSQPTEDTLVDNDVLIDSFTVGGGTWPSLGYGQYGVGSTGSLGFYRIDWEHRLIVFNFGFRHAEIIFEYLGTVLEDGDYAVPALFQEPLIDFIRWQDSIGNAKSNPTERRENKRLYDISFNNARKMMTPFDPSDVYNVNRQSARLSPKA